LSVIKPTVSVSLGDGAWLGVGDGDGDGEGDGEGDGDAGANVLGAALAEALGEVVAPLLLHAIIENARMRTRNKASILFI
jgi:hypothetical protein